MSDTSRAVESIGIYREILSYIQNVFKLHPGFENVTRAEIMYRLNDLRGEGKIKGKRIGAGGKGVWIWWVG